MVVVVVVVVVNCFSDALFFIYCIGKKYCFSDALFFCIQYIKKIVHRKSSLQII